MRAFIYRICYMYKVRHQNPDKSNNFSKRNFIKKEIEYYKKFFYISRNGFKRFALIGLYF